MRNTRPAPKGDGPTSVSNGINRRLAKPRSQCTNRPGSYGRCPVASRSGTVDVHVDTKRQHQLFAHRHNGATHSSNSCVTLPGKHATERLPPTLTTQQPRTTKPRGQCFSRKHTSTARSTPTNSSAEQRLYECSQLRKLMLFSTPFFSQPHRVIKLL